MERMGLGTGLFSVFFIIGSIGYVGVRLLSGEGVGLEPFTLLASGGMSRGSNVLTVSRSG